MSDATKNGKDDLTRLQQVGGEDAILYNQRTGEIQAALEGTHGLDLTAPDAGKAKIGKGRAKKEKRDPVDLEALAKLGKPKGMARPYDPNGEEKYPDLFQLLTMGAYSDGTERILPTIRLYREPGLFCVALQDHEMGRQLRAASVTLEGVWEALEKAMMDPLAWTTFKSMVNRSGEPFSLRKKKPGQTSS